MPLVVYSSTLGLKTSSELQYTGKCACTAFVIITNGSANATLTLYDNTEASGTVRAKLVVPGANLSGGRNYSTYPLRFENGIYAELSGAGASYIVESFGRAT
jgi:hypothetical protein